MARRAVRTGVSLDSESLAALDRWADQRGTGSRSEAIRFLVRKELALASLGDPDSDAVGVVMLLYDHHAAGVQRRLTEAGHRWGDHVRSSTHVHLRGDVCVEVVVAIGHRRELERLADDLRGIKGVHQGDLMLASPGTAGATTGHTHPHR